MLIQRFLSNRALLPIDAGNYIEKTINYSILGEAAVRPTATAPGALVAHSSANIRPMELYQERLLLGRGRSTECNRLESGCMPNPTHLSLRQADPKAALLAKEVTKGLPTTSRDCLLNAIRFILEVLVKRLFDRVSFHLHVFIQCHVGRQQIRYIPDC